MNQPEAFDANSFFLALEFGVGTLVIFGKPFMRKRFPKLDETWFEGSAFALATLILMWFAFRNVVKVPNVKNVIVFCVPYVVVALWVLVMLRFSSTLQATRKRLEEIDDHLHESVRKAFQGIDLASENATLIASIELLKLDTKRIEEQSATQQATHMELMNLRQDLNTLKEGIGVSFSRHEAEQGLTLAKKDEEYKTRLRSVESYIKGLEDEKQKAHQAWLDEKIPCSGKCNGTELRRRDFLKLPEWAAFAHVAGRPIEHVCPRCFVDFSSAADLRTAEKAFT